jgi:hypothetical protein
MNDSNNKIKNTLQKQSQNLKNKHSKPNKEFENEYIEKI